jgi:hypothetical protein
VSRGERLEREDGDMMGRRESQRKGAVKFEICKEVCMVERWYEIGKKVC